MSIRIINFWIDQRTTDVAVIELSASTTVTKTFMRRSRCFSGWGLRADDPDRAAGAPSSPAPAVADRSTTGLTVRRLSQALFRQHRPKAVCARKLAKDRR
jgi:hypothetical protein